MVILKTEVITKPITRVGEKRERTERERGRERNKEKCRKCQTP